MGRATEGRKAVTNKEAEVSRYFVGQRTSSGEERKSSRHDPRLRDREPEVTISEQHDPSGLHDRTFLRSDSHGANPQSPAKCGRDLQPTCASLLSTPGSSTARRNKRHLASLQCEDKSSRNRLFLSESVVSSTCEEEAIDRCPRHSALGLPNGNPSSRRGPCDENGGLVAGDHSPTASKNAFFCGIEPIDDAEKLLTKLRHLKESPKLGSWSSDHLDIENQEPVDARNSVQKLDLPIEGHNGSLDIPALNSFDPDQAWEKAVLASHDFTGRGSPRPGTVHTELSLDSLLNDCGKSLAFSTTASSGNQEGHLLWPDGTVEGNGAEHRLIPSSATHDFDPINALLSAGVDCPLPVEAQYIKQHSQSFLWDELDTHSSRGLGSPERPLPVEKYQDIAQEVTNFSVTEEPVNFEAIATQVSDHKSCDSPYQQGLKLLQEALLNSTRSPFDFARPFQDFGLHTSTAGPADDSALTAFDVDFPDREHVRPMTLSRSQSIIPEIHGFDSQSLGIPAKLDTTQLLPEKPMTASKTTRGSSLPKEDFRVPIEDMLPKSPTTSPFSPIPFAAWPLPTSNESMLEPVEYLENASMSRALGSSDDLREFWRPNKLY